MHDPNHAALRTACSEVVFQMALSDPLEAARALARALQRQTTGGRLTAVRALVAALEAHEPGIAAEVGRHFYLNAPRPQKAAAA